MRITVAICTWNRCGLLKRALEQMLELTIPPGVEWELLVVNNNCTDATDDVIASFDGRLPLRRLFEPQQGQSHARNLAVEESRGDYILWTDDDVLVDKQWVAGYASAIGRWRGAAVFGGPIEPYFAGSPPGWLERTLSQIPSAYAIRDLGLKPVPLARDRLPTGANYAVRTSVQANFLYDPKLGLCGNNQLRGEEMAVLEAIFDAGEHGWWVPGARVRHYITEERQTTRYLRGYFSGIGEYYGRHMSPNGERLVFGRPRWLWRQAVQAEMKYRLNRVLRRPEVWIEDLVAASGFWGRLRGYAGRTRV
jgi:glycosyltransferase involved in cell wall biosynthesis